MKRVCYWCSKYMGQKGDGHEDEVFNSVCDECVGRLGLDERLPELLWAIVAFRRENSSNEQDKDSDILTTAQ